MSDNRVVQNLQNTLGTWNEKPAEIWTRTDDGYFRHCPGNDFNHHEIRRCVRQQQRNTAKINNQRNLESRILREYPVVGN